MANMELHVLIGTALTDRDFCDKLLNGERHLLLATFDLTEEEQLMLQAIQASSIEEFAIQLVHRLQVQESANPRRLVVESHR